MVNIYKHDLRIFLECDFENCVENLRQQATGAMSPAIQKSSPIPPSPLQTLHTPTTTTQGASLLDAFVSAFLSPSFDSTRFSSSTPFAHFRLFKKLGDLANVDPEKLDLANAKQLLCKILSLYRKNDLIGITIINEELASHF